MQYDQYPVAFAPYSHMTSLLNMGLYSPSQVTLDPHVGSHSHAWPLPSKAQPWDQVVLKPFLSNPYWFSVIGLELWCLVALPGLPLREWELDNWFPPSQKDSTPSSFWSTFSPARSAYYLTTSLLLRDFIWTKEVCYSIPYETVSPGRPGFLGTQWKHGALCIGLMIS